MVDNYLKIKFAAGHDDDKVTPMEIGVLSSRDQEAKGGAHHAGSWGGAKGKGKGKSRNRGPTRCFLCQELGHIVRDCQKNVESRARCATCSGYGHGADVCPTTPSS